MSAIVAALAQTGNALAEAATEARRAVGARSALAGVAALGVVVAVGLVPPGIQRADLAADLYLATAAVGLGLAVGLAGLPVLGQGAFLAVGAYAAALLAARAGWPTEAAVLGGALAAATAGALVGVATAWARPAVVAVATWLAAWLVALALAAFPRVSGGAQGVVLPPGDVAGVRLTATAHYVVAACLALATVALFAVVRRSGVGVALAAGRQHRPAAEALGVPVARLRVGAVAACAGVGGLAGGLAVNLAGVADASAYGPLISFELFVALVLGGAASALGGIVGAGFLAIVARLTESGGLEGLQLNRIQTLIAAIVVITALGATDRGLVPALQDFRRRRRPAEAPAGVPPPRARPRPVAPASLAAHGLGKRFGPITALEGFGLDVRGGTIHALLGPNGSGKTTALRLLAGTLAPDAGRIAVDGEEVADEPVQARVRRGIVATLQATAVFPDSTALENAIVGARARSRQPGAVRAVLATPKSRADARETRTRALAALAVVGLSGVAHARAASLDSGAQRRLMIAAALATEPRVLLLDEPAAGASREEIDGLADVLRDLRASGMALVLVEHNLRLVRAVADTATALTAGRTIATGAAEDVLRSEAVRRAHIGSGRL